MLALDWSAAPGSHVGCHPVARAMGRESGLLSCFLRL